MAFSNWSDFYTSSERFEYKVAALKITNLLDVIVVDECTRNLQDHNSLAALIIDNVSGHLILVHHLTKLGKSLMNKIAKMKDKLVALSSAGITESPFRFDHPDSSLGPKCIVEVCIPDENVFKTFEISSEFKKLTADKKTKKSLRNVLLLPPLAISALLSLSSTDPSKWPKPCPLPLNKLRVTFQITSNLMAQIIHLLCVTH